MTTRTWLVLGTSIWLAACGASTGDPAGTGAAATAAGATAPTAAGPASSTGSTATATAPVAGEPAGCSGAPAHPSETQDTVARVNC